jgi:putative FmdB family regulatory protein
MGGATTFPRGVVLPKYQYRCNDCGVDLEVQQKFTDASLTVCPECEGDLRKVFNAVGVVFKGSGFYKTDSRAKATASSGSSESKSETKTETKKSESTTATTAA